MNIENIFCLNEKCKHFSKINAGNLKVKQISGESQKIDLMQCLSCRETFS